MLAQAQIERAYRPGAAEYAGDPLERIRAMAKAERRRVKALIADRSECERVPPQAEQHGDYREEFVTEVDTNTKALVKRNRSLTPLTDMHERGGLTDDQHCAALEIARIVETIESAVNVRCASLEARVDNARGRDPLIERLGRVRLEVTYSWWRNQLPVPRRMVLDMVLTNRPLVATARVHGVPWRIARKRLIDALDRWLDFKERIWRMVDEDNVEAVYRKLGCGTLLPPGRRS